MGAHQLGLVGGEGSRLAHRFHRGDAAAVDEQVRRAHGLDVGVAREERHGAHVLLDEVLRIPSRDQRQEQHRVHLGDELRRVGRELHDRQLGGRLPDEPDELAGVGVGAEAVPDEERGGALPSGAPGELDGGRRRAARRIDERHDAAPPLEPLEDAHARDSRRPRSPSRRMLSVAVVPNDTGASAAASKA